MPGVAVDKYNRRVRRRQWRATVGVEEADVLCRGEGGHSDRSSL